MKISEKSAKNNNIQEGGIKHTCSFCNFIMSARMAN